MKTNTKQKKGKKIEFYSTSINGTLVTGNSKEEFAQNLRDARQN